MHLKGIIFLRLWLSVWDRERVLIVYGLMIQSRAAGHKILAAFYAWRVLRMTTYCLFLFPWRKKYIGEILKFYEIIKERDKDEDPPTEEQSKDQVERYEDLIIELCFTTGTPVRTLKEGLDPRHLERLVKTKDKIKIKERMERVADQHSKPDTHFDNLKRDLQRLETAVSAAVDLMDTAKLDERTAAAVKQHLEQSKNRDPYVN